MSDFYKCKPSEVIHLEDEYTSFCFDEACLYISLQIQNGLEPTFVLNEKQSGANSTKVVRTPKDVYAKFENN